MSLEQSTPAAEKRYIRIARKVELPNPVAVARCRRIPELGPRILFFSGGTALRRLSRELVNYTHNSVHLITPFDSGGSSAVLRKAFSMPAVGDIRNRLMALADRGFTGNPKIFDLFSFRFPKTESNVVLKRELAAMADGTHGLVAAIHDPMRKIIRQYLYDFKNQMPSDFNLKGANIGNLILTSGYLLNRRHLDPVTYIFSRLVNVLGVVHPVINKDLHLAVELENGERIIGQHRITGKESAPLTTPVHKLVLSALPDRWEPTFPAIRERIRSLILKADLIYYPMGSFYSSILANLLPKGIAQTVAARDCPKVYIPSTGRDPEAVGLPLAGQVKKLLDCLRQDAPHADPQQLLQFIIVDLRSGKYAGKIDEKDLRRLGITLIDADLVDTHQPPYLDPQKLVPLLLSLS